MLDKLKGVKAIIFDADGVLIRTNYYHLLSLEHVFRQQGVKVPRKEIEHLFGEPAREIIRELLLKKHISDFDLREMIREKTRFFRKEVKGKNLLFRATPFVLSELRKKFKLALVTGAGRNVLNLTFPKKEQKKFQVVLTATDYKKGKPNPEPLLLAAKMLGVKPRDCVYVGDSVIDIVAAKNARMRVIAVPSGIYSEKELLKARPTKLIKNLRSILKLLN